MLAHGANAELIGQGVNTFVDKAGKEFGKEMMDTAQVSICTLIRPPVDGLIRPAKTSFFPLQTG